MDGIVLPVALLALAVVTFFMEAFVPSGGLITVIGLCCVGGAIAFAFSLGGTNTGVVFVGISIVLVPASLISAFALLRKTPLGRRLTLQRTQKVEEGYVAQDSREQELLGQTGVAVSMLRPSGEARIAGRRYDVMTEGELIEQGTEIVVRRVEGNRIVVRKVRSKSGNE